MNRDMTQSGPGILNGQIQGWRRAQSFEVVVERNFRRLAFPSFMCGGDAGDGDRDHQQQDNDNSYCFHQMECNKEA
jgi:hypothetical protein